MNRQSALFPAAQVAHEPGNNLMELFLAKVLDFDLKAGKLRVVMDDGSQPHDALMMTPHGNAASGWVWLPQIGDLVVLAFIGGRKRVPIVLGSVYDFRDVLPTQTQDQFRLLHQSGSSLAIDPDGTLHLMQAAGAELKIDANEVNVSNHGTTVNVAPTGDVTVTHANGQQLLLGGTRVEADSANGLTKLAIDNGSAILSSGTGTVQVNSGTGQILISPGLGSTVVLGGGVNPAVMDGDVTGPAIGAGVPAHFHQIIGGSTKVVLG